MQSKPEIVDQKPAIVVEASKPEVTQPEPVKQEEPKKEEPKTVHQLIDQEFPANARPMARKIMNCESGGKEKAVGDTTLTFYVKDKNNRTIQYGASYGYFQIRHLPGRPTPSYLLEGENNVKYAANMYRNEGWRPWSCWKKVR